MKILVRLCAGLMLAGGIVCLPYAPAAAQEEALVTVTVPLQFTRASDLEKALRSMSENGKRNVEGGVLPQGIRQMVANDRDNTLTLRGTAGAIARVKKAILLLDVRPRQVLIKARLLRVSSSPDGDPVEQVLQAPIISTLNNRVGTVSISHTDRKTGRAPGAQSISLQPHINGDGSITISAEVDFFNGSKWTARAIRRVAAGQTMRILGMTDFADKGLRGKVSRGDIPRPLPAGFVGYYVEVTPTEVKGANEARP